MKLFLDTSVLLAACGSAQGSSRALFQSAQVQGWELLASPWVVGEVARNLVKFPAAATAEWLRLRRQLVIVDDVVSLDRVLVFPVSKDRPVLLSALATAQPVALCAEHAHKIFAVERADSAPLRFPRAGSGRRTAPASLGQSGPGHPPVAYSLHMRDCDSRCRY